MTSSEIRQRFLDFFRQKGHDIVKSAPMVIKNDPTLMFTNAGMNQFKDFFLGNKQPENPRIADTQKCLRVSGKHNDLEEVGIDTYHHTMFEMLGNWSIGEYFKVEAIEWAMEFLTKELNISTKDMYATVFQGDDSEALEADTEAYNVWKKFLPEEKILYQDKKDNFWEMGDTGPCGPSSEIHVDLRSEEEKRIIPGAELINKDHPHVIEIWNLVFIQFNRMASGELVPLKAKHVDTGMGFERLCMLMQGKKSNYDTDVFTPLIQEIEKISGVRYGEGEKTDIAIRVIADHIRAVAMAISEGQLPSNVKAGYVIRRILRRAVRYGYTFLQLKEPFFHKLIPVLARQFSGVFEEIPHHAEFTAKVILEEENSFLRTLENGLKRLGSLIENYKRESKKIIEGHIVFELYDTYGFPVDLTALIARENSLTIDEKGFEKEMAVQKGRSKQDAEKSAEDWVLIAGGETEFLGYEHLEAECRILKYRKEEQKGTVSYQLVLDRTPFYPEGGGQVGDTGILQNEESKIRIKNTIREHDSIIHIADKLPEPLDHPLHAKVDITKRRLTENNHSATHLLHAALRQVLGKHVQQKGSLVNDKILRFDFSHFSKMTDEEIREVEHLVNQKIRQDIQRLEDREIPFDIAVEKGAMALFGEKYGDKVRMITFDPEYSIELCGGTHVSATGKIGFFKIISEGSVAAGVRRIEAITADAAEEYVDKRESQFKALNEILKHPKDITKSVKSLLEERNKLSKALEALEAREVQSVKQEIESGIENINGHQILNKKLSLPNAESLKQLLFELKQKYPSLFAVIEAEVNSKPMIGVMISESILEDSELHAGKLVKEWAKLIKGGGGGQPFFATAGGTDMKGLDEVNKVVKEFIDSKFKA